MTGSLGRRNHCFVLQDLRIKRGPWSTSLHSEMEEEEMVYKHGNDCYRISHPDALHLACCSWEPPMSFAFERVVCNHGKIKRAFRSS